VCFAFGLTSGVIAPRFLTRFTFETEIRREVSSNPHLGRTRQGMEPRKVDVGLLQNTLDLLDELVDTNDDDDRNAQRRRHDTIGAAVCEHLADTFLWNHNDVDVHSDSDQRAMDSSSPKYYTSDFMVVIVLTSREDCLSSAKVYPVVGKCPDPLTIGFSCQLIIDSPLSK